MVDGETNCVQSMALLRRAIIERCEVDDAEVEDVVQGARDLELLPEFPEIQCLHEIAEDSGEEGVADPPQAPIPQPAAEGQPLPTEKKPASSSFIPCCPLGTSTGSTSQSKCCCSKWGLIPRGLCLAS